MLACFKHLLAHAPDVTELQSYMKSYTDSQPDAAASSTPSTSFSAADARGGGSCSGGGLPDQEEAASSCQELHEDLPSSEALAALVAQQLAVSNAEKSKEGWMWLSLLDWCSQWHTRGAGHSCI